MLDLLFPPARRVDEIRILTNGFETAFAELAHSAAMEAAIGAASGGERQVLLQAAAEIELRNRQRIRRCGTAFGRLAQRLSAGQADCAECPAEAECGRAAGSRLARTPRHQ